MAGLPNGLVGGIGWGDLARATTMLRVDAAIDVSICFESWARLLGYTPQIMLSL